MHMNAAEIACSQHTRPRSWLLPRQMGLLSHSTHLCLLKSQINLVTSTPAFLGVATKLASDAKTCLQTISKRSLQSWPLRLGCLQLGCVQCQPDCDWHIFGFDKRFNQTRDEHCLSKIYTTVNVGMMGLGAGGKSKWQLHKTKIEWNMAIQEQIEGSEPKE